AVLFLGFLAARGWLGSPPDAPFRASDERCLVWMPLVLTVTACFATTHLLPPEPSPPTMLPALLVMSFLACVVGLSGPLLRRVVLHSRTPAERWGPALIVAAWVATAAARRPLLVAGAEGFFRSDPQVPPPAVVRAPRPNIVLVVLDTVRAASTSCLGYPRASTPAP